MIKLSDVKVGLRYRGAFVIALWFWRMPAVINGRPLVGATGVSARTVRRWRKRWRGEGLNGLVPRYPDRRQRRVTIEVLESIRYARQELAYGAARTRLWLLRRHCVRLAMGTVQRIVVDLGLPYLRRSRKRAPRQLKLFEKLEPGDSVQADVKFVKIRDRWAFQYTALDDCTRFRVLRLYRGVEPGVELGHERLSLAWKGQRRPKNLPFAWRHRPPNSRNDAQTISLNSSQGRPWSILTEPYNAKPIWPVRGITD